jgi:hypothetical protein
MRAVRTRHHLARPRGAGAGQLVPGGWVCLLVRHGEFGSIRLSFSGSARAVDMGVVGAGGSCRNRFLCKLGQLLQRNPAGRDGCVHVASAHENIPCATWVAW